MVEVWESWQYDLGESGGGQGQSGCCPARNKKEEIQKILNKIFKEMKNNFFSECVPSTWLDYKKVLRELLFEKGWDLQSHIDGSREENVIWTITPIR